MDQQTGTFDHWGHVTLNILHSLLRDYGSTSTGLMPLAGYEYSRERRPLPYFTRQVVGFREVEAAELKTLGIPGQWAFHYTSVMADMTSYLPFLHREFERLGGKFVYGEVQSLAPPYATASHTAAVLAAADLLVNCSGLGARTLVPDPHMHPIRGYLVRVQAPFIHTWYRDMDSWTYVFPRMNEVNLGGTYDVDVDDTNTNSTLRHQIIERCAAIIPELKTCPVVSEWSGLRPGRDVLRLELELVGGRCVQLDEGRRRLEVGGIAGAVLPVIHNYGAGGSGMTIHWGCAEEVVELVKKVRPPHGKPLWQGDTLHGFQSPKLGEESEGLITTTVKGLIKLAKL